MSKNTPRRRWTRGSGQRGSKVCGSFAFPVPEMLDMKQFAIRENVFFGLPPVQKTLRAREKNIEELFSEGLREVVAIDCVK